MPRHFPHRVLTGVLLAASFLSAGALAQLDIGVDYDPDRNLLICGGSRFQFLFPEASRRAIYEVALPRAGPRRTIWEGNWPLTHVRVAPGGGKIAFVEYVKREDVSEADPNYANDTLRVITLDGQILRSADQVYRYVWSPDGNHIAFIRGEPYEGGIGFTNSSTWVMDISTGRTEQIMDRGHDIFWAGFDNNLYIWLMTTDPVKVWRYKPAEGTLEPTAYKGIFFSPDGRYYHRPSYEGSTFRLFEREENREITADLEFFAGFEYLFVQPSRWLDAHRLIIPEPSAGERVDYVFDIEKDSARVVRGAVMPLGGERLLVVEKGEMRLEALEALEEVRRPRPE